MSFHKWDKQSRDAAERAAKITNPVRYRIAIYAAQNGARWREALCADWQSGKDATLRDGYLLRQARNQIGPRGLNYLSLTSEGALVVRDIKGGIVG